MKFNVREINTKSNYVSLLRLFLAVPLFFLFANVPNSPNNRFIIVGLYFLAYFTDILDGYLARKYNEITETGKIIDPLADKIFVLVSVIMLFSIGYIPEYYFIIIIVRDVFIFAGGIYISQKIGKVLPSNLLGKITVFSIGIFLIIATLKLNALIIFYDIFLYLSIIMSILSIIGYAIRGSETLKWYNETK